MIEKNKTTNTLKIFIIILALLLLPSAYSVNLETYNSDFTINGILKVQSITSSGAVTSGGNTVCTAQNGLCATTTPYQSSAGGWTNTSTQTTTSLNTGIGTTTPRGILDVRSDVTNSFFINNSAGGIAKFYATTPGSRDRAAFEMTGYIDHEVPVLLINSTNSNPGCSGCVHYGEKIYAEDGRGTGTTTIGLYVSATNATYNYAALFANGNVGIGTTSPATPLHIAGSGRVETRVQSGSSYLSLYNDGASHIGSNGNLIYYDSGLHIFLGQIYASNNIYGGNAASGNLTIDSTASATKGSVNIQPSGGYVGIGTSSPITNLEVDHNGASNYGVGILIKQNAIGNSDGPRIEFYKTMTTSKSWTAGMLNGVNVGDFGISESGDIVGGFGTPRLTVQAGGNVGIGTISPTSKLTTYYTSSLANVHDPQYAGLNVWGSSSVRLLFGTDTASPYGAYIQATNTGTGFPILLNPGGGYVGIGTTSPGYALDVAGATGIGFVDYLTNRLNGARISTYGNTVGLRAASSGTDQVTLTSAGNLGIGTASPQAKLDVMAGAAGRMILSDNYNSDQNQNSPKLSFVGMNNAPDSGWNIQAITMTGYSQKDLVFSGHSGSDYVSQQERLRINYLGNVGIGTASPGGKLDVNGSIKWGGGSSAPYVFSSIDPNGMYIEQAGSSTLTENIRIQSSKSGDMSNYAMFNIDPTSGFSFATTGTGNGNVGIGTTSPNAKLHLLVPDDTGLRIQAGESGWGSARVEFYSDPIGASQWRPGYIASGDNGAWGGRLDFYTNGIGSSYKEGSVLGMSIYNRNVGIGTMTPSARLEIVDTASTSLKLRVAGGNSDFVAGSTGRVVLAGNPINSSDGILFNINSPKLSFWGSEYDITGPSIQKIDEGLGYGAGSLVFLQHTQSDSTNEYEAMRIKSNGNVGIGTTNPQTALNTYIAPTSGFVEQIRVGGTSNYPSLTFGTKGAYDGYMATYGNDLHILAGKGVTTENHNIHFYTGFVGGTTGAENYERMTIRYDGNVGIGTTSPNSKLRVVGDAGTFVFPIRIAKSNYADAGGHTSLIGFGVENGLWSKGAVGYTRTGGYDTGYLGFYVNGDVNTSDITSSDLKMMINNNGNVGIGTTSPGEKLEVSGNALVGYSNWLYGWNWNSGSKQPLIRSKGMGYSPGYAGLQIGQTTDHIALFIDPSTIAGGAFNGNTNEVMLPNAVSFLYANTAGTDWKQWMSVSNGATSFLNGDVGIGQPYAFSFANGQTIRDNGNGGLAIYSAAGLQLTGTSYTSISGGNVGIGTTSPGAKLHIYAPSTGTNVPGIFIDKVYGNTGDTSAAIRLTLNSGAGGVYLSGYAGDGVITHNSEYIASTGHVARDASVEQIDFISGISFNVDSGKTVGAVFTPTTRMKIDQAGNVGIGTTTPGAKLDVNIPNVGGTNLMYFSNSAGGAGDIARIQYGAGGEFILNLSSNAAYNRPFGIINGNVGIGTSGGAILRPLNIKPSSDIPQLYLAQSNNDAGGWMFRAGVDGHLHMISYQGAESEKLTIKYDTGSVGIGTNSPGTKLDVAGGIVRESGYLLSDAATDNLLVNGDFEMGSTYGWTGFDTVTTTAYSGNYAAQRSGGNTVLSDDYIPVNPVTDVFQLEGYFRKTVAGSTPGIIYFGYIAYDANKNAITSSPCGTYCYFAASGYTLPVDSAWHKLSSTTTGEGTSYPNFPVGTKYVRVLVLINYGSTPDAVTLMDHVTLKKINNGPLFVGNNFDSTNLVDQKQMTKLYTDSSNNFIITPPSSNFVGIHGNLIMYDGYLYSANVNKRQITLNSNYYTGTIQNDASSKWSLGWGPTGTDALGTSVLTWTTDTRIGIGTTSPAYTLDVNGNAHRADNSLYWTQTSDERLKTNITTLNNSLSSLGKLRGVTFNWKNSSTNDTSIQMGFIAQEVETVFPQWVGTTSDGYKNLNPSGIDALLVNGVNELNNKTKTMEQENVLLKNNITTLITGMNTLEQKNKLLLDAICRIKPDDPICT